MSIALRVILIVFSVLNCTWVLLNIRKSQFKIEDSIFWILYSGLLILMSLFPSLLSKAANWVGVQSPVNFIFLAIIFLLQIKLFRLSLRASQLEHKLQSFAQRYAIDQNDMVSLSDTEKEKDV